MKSIVKFFILVCGICLLNACDETGQNGEKPSPIVESTVIITAIHGGATITYDIPEDRGILYVMAEYERNGKPFTERSSTFKNSITIEGFDTVDPVNVILYTVSRDQEIKSDPLKVQFVPLESPISLIVKSTVIEPTFGGILISWENNTKIEVGVRIMLEEEGEMIEKEMFFSNLESERRPFRGLEPVETSFCFVFEDKWGNVSNPILYTGIPFFEKEVPKPWGDLRHTIPYDNVTANGTNTFDKLWDGSLELTGRYLNVSGSTGSSFTFDLKNVFKLSRFTLWYYHNNGASVSANCSEWEMWGTKTLDLVKEHSYWLHPFSAAQTGQQLPAHTFMDDWVYLGRYKAPDVFERGLSAAAIVEIILGGFSYDIPLVCDPVRYIRFFPITTYGVTPPQNNYWMIGEMSFFGDDSVSQE